MDYRTTRLLKQLGIIFLAAAVLTMLPRLLVASVFSLISLLITVAMIWILYQAFGPIVRDYLRRRQWPPRGPRPPQNRWSDRR